MQPTITSTETAHSLQDIVMSLAGFIMSGHSIEDVDEEVLIILKRSITLELEERQGMIH